MNGRSALVLGLGESGLAMARWLRRAGARVRVADTRAAPPARDALDADCELRLGAFDATLLDGVDLVAISPGLAPSAEPQAALLAQAAARGIAVVGEIELFARELAALKAERGYAPRVIAITGTNGKTTVTRLVGAMCSAAGRRVAVAGNISPAALDALAAALDRQALPDIWVLELSSFQLATTTSLAPDAATVLNVTQDHLDWHGDMDAYVAAKARIFAASTVRVLNRDDARVVALEDPENGAVRFGLDAPTLPGDLGVVAERDELGLRWLAVAEGEDPDAEARGRGSKKAIVRRRASKVVALESIAPIRVKRLMPIDALRIRGDHNVANMLAALALARAIGLPMAPLLRAAIAYRGEPHRVSFVIEHDGVDYIDDSKGTNVGATVAALSGVASGPGRKVVLIAGGIGKGQDFAPLVDPVAAHARAVVLIGRDKGALRDTLRRSGVPLVDCDTLDDAVEEAARRAEAGDVVLLSPACASLDMFRDYAHRAEVFVAAVERLARSASPAEPATC